MGTSWEIAELRGARTLSIGRQWGRSRVLGHLCGENFAGVNQDGPVNRADAVLIAEDLVRELAPLCERIEIAGSIRRMKYVVNDIDLVVIPREREI